MNRVAIFIPSLCGGGTERVMLNLSRSFAEHGIQTDIVLAQGGGFFLEEGMVPPGVNIIELGAIRVLFSLPGFVRYLKANRPIAVLSGLDHTNITALWARHLAKVPTRIIVSCHTHLSHDIAHAANTRTRLLPMLIRRLYPHADGIVAVSRGAAHNLAQICRLPLERIQVIQNPVVTHDLIALSQAPLPHPWFESGEPPVVLSAGRFVAAKNYPALIQAFALVRKQRSARLMIIGEGDKRHEIESLIRKLHLQEDVALPGFAENPFVYMAHAAVFAVSSIYEGLPNVLVEALAVGTPVISTDCESGPREILRNGQYGDLVPVGDIPALANGILKILDNPRRVIPHEAWQPYELHRVTERYLRVMGVMPDA